jgi:hemerythrin superfamily protein
VAEVCGRQAVWEVVMAKKQKSTNDNAGAGEGLDAIQLLESQHRAVDRLFQSIGDGSNGKETQPTVLQIIDKLTAHAAIEERHFYPAVRSADTEDLIDDAYEDHREVKEICLHLLDIGPSDENYQAKVEELQGLVEEHVSVEESELFPMARALLDASELEALGQQMVATMTDLEQEGSAREQLANDLGEGARE